MINSRLPYSNSSSNVDSVSIGIAAGQPSTFDLSDALCQIYSSIGEPDGIYGCGSVLVSDNQRCIDMHLREQDWAQAASASICSSTSNASSTHSLSTSLIQMNLAKVAHSFLASEHRTDSEDYYETAMMLSKWDVEVSNPKHGVSPPFYQSIHQSCSALSQGNHPASLLHKNQAVNGLLRQIEILPQSADSLTPILAKMKIIQVNCVFSPTKFQDVRSSEKMMVHWYIRKRP